MNKKRNYSNEIIEYILTMVIIVLLVFIAKALGLQGVGYFGVTIALFSVITFVFVGWTSSFLSKYIKGRSTRKQYKNAAVFWKSAMISIGLFSAIISIALFLCSNLIGEVLLKDIHIGFCIKVAAPFVFLYAMSSLFCGYYKGLGMKRPITIYLCIKALITVSGSIYFMILCMNQGKKISLLLQNDTITYIYGAVGTLIGFVAGQAFGLLVLFVFWLLLHKEFKALIHSDITKYSESIADCVKTICISGGFSGLKNLLLFSAPLVNYILYMMLYTKAGADPGLIMGGCLFGLGMPCMLFIVLLFTCMNHNGYKGMANLVRNEDYTQIKRRFYNMILGVCSFGLYITVTFAVLSPILNTFLIKGWPDGRNTFIYCTILCAVLVVTEIIVLRFMNYIHNTMYVYVCSAAAFILQILVCISCIKVFSLGSYSILIGMMVNGILVCILCLIKLRKRIRFQLSDNKRLIMACIISLAAALITMLLYQLLKQFLSGLILFIISFLPGFIAYLLGMVYLQILDYDEIEQVPFGGMVLQTARLLRRE